MSFLILVLLQVPESERNMTMLKKLMINVLLALVCVSLTHSYYFSAVGIQELSLSGVDFEELQQPFVSSIEEKHEFRVEALNAHVDASAEEHRISTEAATFTCQSMSTGHDPLVFCSGIVDYSFVVSNTMTAATLNTNAKAWAGYYSTLLNSTCLGDLKRMICSATYLQCSPNVVPGNVSTYEPYTVGANIFRLPYRRPCRSLCTATTYLGKACMGKLELLGVAPFCGRLDVNSGLPLYDALSTPLSANATKYGGVCNDLPNVKGQALVADAAEPYVGETCAGVITDYYVPAPTQLNASYAPWQPPFYLQSLQEARVYSIAIDSVPQIYSGECNLAARKLYCSTLLLKPEANYALNTLYGTIYLPSFPDLSICEDFNQACRKGLIESVPSTKANCSAMVQNLPGVHLYPNSTQAIVTLSFASGLVLPLTTNPNTLPNVTLTLPTQCPIGHSPFLTHARGQIEIGSTSCALNCASPSYTQSEYKYMVKVKRIGVCVLLILIGLQLINISVLKPAKQNIFLVSSIGMSFIYQFFLLLQLLVLKEDDAGLICESDTVAYTRVDYDKNVQAGVCVVSALANVWLGLLSQWVILALSAEIWVRVAWGVKKVNFHRYFYMYGSLFVFVAHGLVLSLYGNPDVVDYIPFCTWVVDDTDLQYQLSTLPSTVYFGISLLLVAHSLFICVRTSLRVADADNKPIRKIWRAYSMLFLFLFLEIAIYPVSLFYYLTYEGYVKLDGYVDSVTDWIDCMFNTFKTSANTEYIEQCGALPGERMSVVAQTVPSLVVNVAAGVVLLGITMNKEVRQFWVRKFDVILYYTGLSRLFSAYMPEQGKKYWRGLLAPAATSFFSTSSAYDYEQNSNSSRNRGIGNKTRTFGGKVLELSLTLKNKSKYNVHAKIIPASAATPVGGSSHNSNSTNVGKETTAEEGEGVDAEQNLFEVLEEGKEGDKGLVMTSRQDSNHDEV